jgi:hypothetical protein
MPMMTLSEVKAAALALPRREQVELLYALEDSVYPPIDPADLAESRWIMDEIRAGRMETVPAEEVLAELDRIAEWGWEDMDEEFKAEINRRVDEIESGTARIRSAEEVFEDMKARRQARAQRDEPDGNTDVALTPPADSP